MNYFAVVLEHIDLEEKQTFSIDSIDEARICYLFDAGDIVGCEFFQ